VGGACGKKNLEKHKQSVVRDHITKIKLSYFLERR